MSLNRFERSIWAVLKRLLPYHERVHFLADLLEEADRIPGVAERHGWIRRQLIDSIPHALKSAWMRAVRTLHDDVRQAFRSLRGGRRNTLLVTSVFAVGLTTTAIVFAALKAVLLDPLPYPDAASLFVLKTHQPLRATSPRGVSGPDLYDYREALGTDVRLGVFDATLATLTDERLPAMRIEVARADRTALEITGAAPLLGRTFSAAEDSGPEPSLVAVLSESIWRNRFGAGRDVLGRSVTLDGATHTIIGVLPAGYGLPHDRVSVWTPLGESPRGLHRRAPVLDVVLRIPDGRGLEALEERVAVIAAELAEAHPATNDGRSALLLPLVQDLAGADGKTLPIVMIIAMIMLAVAVVNALGLLIGRTIRRRAEFGLREALGAGRGRVARQLLFEVFFQVFLAFGLSLALASMALGGVAHLWPSDFFRADSIALDLPGVAFAGALAVVIGGLFALLVPGLARDPASVGARRGDPALRAHVRAGLLTVQVAAAVVLVLGSSSLLKGLLDIVTVDRGLVLDELVVAAVNLPADRYPTGMARYPDWPEVHSFHRELIARLGADPGVRGAALAGSNLLRPPGFRLGVGLRTSGAVDTVEAAIGMVSAGWRNVVGIDLLAGRGLTDTDTKGSEPVVVVNETLWRDLLGQGPEPWGTIDYLGAERRIVGIVEDIVPAPGTASQPVAFSPLTQTPSEWLSVMVRTRGAPSARIGVIRDAVAELDPDVAVYDERTMVSVEEEALSRPRLHSSIVALLSTVVLVLAGVGLFALLTEAVATRRNEIGVRLALGARGLAVMSAVLRETGRAVSAGLMIGGAVSWLGLDTVQRLLPEAAGLEPAPVLAAVAVLAATCLVASAAPLLQAVRTDPAICIRAD